MLRSLIAVLLILLVLSKPGSQKKSAVLKVLDVDLSGENLQVPYVLTSLDPAKAIMIIVEQSP